MPLVQDAIESKVKKEYKPIHLEVLNESGNHNVPPGSESHFKVVLVSERFIGVDRIERHKLVHQTLAEELTGSVHALSLKLFAPDEYEGTVPESPPCRGGGEA